MALPTLCVKQWQKAISPKQKTFTEGGFTSVAQSTPQFISIAAAGLLGLLATATRGYDTQASAHRTFVLTKTSGVVDALLCT